MCGQREILHSVDRNGNKSSHSQNQYRDFSKIPNSRSVIRPTCATFGYLLNGFWVNLSQWYLYINVCCSTIHNIELQEQLKCPIQRNDEKIVCIHNEPFFSCKEQSDVVYKKKDTTGKYFKWIKTLSERQVQYSVSFVGSKLLLLGVFLSQLQKINWGSNRSRWSCEIGKIRGLCGFMMYSIYTIYLYEHALVLNSSMYNEYNVQRIYAMKTINVLLTDIVYYHEYMNMWIFSSTVYIYITAFTTYLKSGTKLVISKIQNVIVLFLLFWLINSLGHGTNEVFFCVCGGITVRVTERKPTMYTVFLAHTTLADNSHEVF